MKKEDKVKELERIDLWINNADTKISYLLAFLGIVATIIFTSGSVMSKVRECFDNLLKLSKQDIENILSLVVITLVANLVFFIAKSIYYLLKASAAQIDVSNTNNSSTLFFGSIATNTLKQFKEKVKKQTDEELEEDITEQIFINSKICSEKMKNYNKAIKNLKISMVIFIIVIVSMIVM